MDFTRENFGMNGLQQAVFDARRGSIAHTLAEEATRLSTAQYLIKGESTILREFQKSQEMFDFARKCGAIDNFGLLEQAAAQLSIADEVLSNAEYSLTTNKTVEKLVASVANVESNALLNAVSESSAFQRSVLAMQTPYIDLVDANRSILAMTELHAVGILAARSNAMHDNTSLVIREALGDWREQIDFEPRLLSCHSLRTEFYIARGFNPHLTEFGDEVFDEAIEITGLSIPDKKIQKIRGWKKRSNKAHRIMIEFEEKIRNFVDELMTKEFGSDWPRHQLPNGMYDQWVNARDKSLAKGRPAYALIYYADFTHYVGIIRKRDNWNTVFGQYFLSSTSVLESFQRLFPLRIDTMHARKLSKDDILFLTVEIKRISNVLL